MSDNQPGTPAQDRMPMLPDAALTDAQRRAVDAISAGPRGGLIGPFVPLLRSPEMMDRLQRVGEYIRFGSVLDDDLVELVILQVARYWDQQFEWGYHHPIALRVGLPAEVVDAVASGSRPTHGRPEVVLVWDLVDELLRSRQVSGELYASAVACLGETRIIEVVGTAGYYATLAMVMNVANTPPPSEAPRLPQRFLPSERTPRRTS